jgi:hypothetical protein
MPRLRLPATLVLVSLVLPVVAHADADPASDTLYTGRVFLPLSATVSPRLARQLDAVTLEAERAGRPVRVALIASKTDLGGVPSLFGKPTTYARFLAGELQFVYPGKVLIVMPQGAALGDHARLVANRDVLDAQVEPGPDGLALTAIALVRKLAGVGRPSDEGSGISPWVWVAAGVALFVLVGAGIALARRPRGAS